VCLSDTARNGPTPVGMAGLRHKLRHKNTRPIPSIVPIVSIVIIPSATLAGYATDAPGDSNKRADDHNRRDYPETELVVWEADRAKAKAPFFRDTRGENWEILSLKGP
jgi:hypothetical protein